MKSVIKKFINDVYSNKVPEYVPVYLSHKHCYIDSLLINTLNNVIVSINVSNILIMIETISSVLSNTDYLFDVLKISDEIIKDVTDHLFDYLITNESTIYNITRYGVSDTDILNYCYIIIPWLVKNKRNDLAKSFLMNYFELIKRLLYQRSNKIYKLQTDILIYTYTYYSVIKQKTDLNKLFPANELYSFFNTCEKCFIQSTLRSIKYYLNNINEKHLYNIPILCTYLKHYNYDNTDIENLILTKYNIGQFITLLSNLDSNIDFLVNKLNPESINVISKYIENNILISDDIFTYFNCVGKIINNEKIIEIFNKLCIYNLYYNGTIIIKIHKFIKMFKNSEIYPRLYRIFKEYSIIEQLKYNFVSILIISPEWNIIDCEDELRFDESFFHQVYYSELSKYILEFYETNRISNMFFNFYLNRGSIELDYDGLSIIIRPSHYIILELINNNELTLKLFFENQIVCRLQKSSQQLIKNRLIIVNDKNIIEFNKNITSDINLIK